MPKYRDFRFSRKRGVVWVCDIVESSSFINDNSTVGELEVFLPRLYWVAQQVVQAAGGTFVKWTGDGFLAWFETPLHRDLESRASAAVEAAFHLTQLVNVTQLLACKTRKFSIRHGVSYEQDALVIHINRNRRQPSFDIIGRAVVLAFRAAGIGAGFPHIVAQDDVIRALPKEETIRYKFGKLKLTREAVLKYFKGQRWQTGALYASGIKRSRKTSMRALLRRSKKALKVVDQPEKHPAKSVFSGQFIKRLDGGPGWARDALETYYTFIERDIAGALRDFVKRASVGQIYPSQL